MADYEQQIRKELLQWKSKMLQTPSFLDRKTQALQQKLNSYIPEKMHRVITEAIRQMVKVVLFGAGHTTGRTPDIFDLQQTEYLVEDKITVYKNAAALEGGITGMGGILSGLADLPLFLSIKIKMLFEIAALYGFNVNKKSERLYLLDIFQLAFSSQRHRRAVFLSMQEWKSKTNDKDLEHFDWRKFQQEYRDHIDLAKLAQMLPGIGAVVGFVVNARLTRRLGNYAMNAYRMRLLGG